jgi:hypothetical protein
MKRKRGANIAHTIKCLLIIETEIHDIKVSINWRNDKNSVSGTINKPSISHPNVFKKRNAPPIPK